MRRCDDDSKVKMIPLGGRYVWAPSPVAPDAAQGYAPPEALDEVDAFVVCPMRGGAASSERFDGQAAIGMDGGLR